MHVASHSAVVRVCLQNNGAFVVKLSAETALCRLPVNVLRVYHRDTAVNVFKTKKYVLLLYIRIQIPDFTNFNQLPVTRSNLRAERPSARGDTPP